MFVIYSSSSANLIINTEKKSPTSHQLNKYVSPVVKHVSFTACSHQTFQITAALCKISQGVKQHGTEKAHASTQSQQAVRTLT